MRRLVAGGAAAATMFLEAIYIVSWRVREWVAWGRKGLRVPRARRFFFSDRPGSVQEAKHKKVRCLFPGVLGVVSSDCCQQTLPKIESASMICDKEPRSDTIEPGTRNPFCLRIHFDVGHEQQYIPGVTQENARAVRHVCPHVPLCLTTQPEVRV